MNKSHVFLLATLPVLACICGCVTVKATAIAPTTLRAVTPVRSIELASARIATRADSKLASYTLPPGPYYSVAENDQGTFYRCLSGIVARVDAGTQPTFMALQGGIYVPADPRQDASPWLVADARNAVAGQLALERSTAEKMAAQCAGAPTRPSIVAEGPARVILVDVVPAGPGADRIGTAQKLGTSVAASVASTYIVDAMISSNDGNFVIPEVSLDGGQALRTGLGAASVQGR